VKWYRCDRCDVRGVGTVCWFGGCTDVVVLDEPPEKVPTNGAGPHDYRTGE